ncbi:MAG: hypothetical protein ACOZQL_32685 [Myxococcota bacterium]
MARSSLLLILVALTVSSCRRDEGAEAWARAQAAHRSLLAQSVAAEDPRFDAVLADLERVPPGSKHRAAAEQLARAIRGARVSVRTPLAIAPKESRPPELQAQLAACARLAQLAGADGGVDRRALEALEDCRRKAEKLELKLSHHDEHDELDGGAP